MNKKIFFISFTSGRDGATRVMSLLMNEYAKQGCDVTFVVRDIFQQIELDKNVNVIQLGKNSRFSKRYFIKWLRNYVKIEKPDVVVSFLLMPNIITLLATRGIETRVVISERNDPTAYKISYKILSKIFYRFTDAMVFQTERAQNCYSKTLQSKGTIIRNPVAVQNYAVDSVMKFVSAGRLEPQKNQKMLIKAFSSFHKTHPQHVLYIYGEGSLRSELESLIGQLGMQDSIFLPGNVTEIHDKIKDAECFILPSNFEGLSNALLEAMMMGLPCISTCCSGSDEIIENGVNGLLVELDNAVEMEQAMKRVADSIEFRRSLANNAFESAKNYSVESIIDQWKKVIG